jgi:hypothetical protein
LREREREKGKKEKRESFGMYGKKNEKENMRKGEIRYIPQREESFKERDSWKRAFFFEEKTMF